MDCATRAVTPSGKITVVHDLSSKSVATRKAVRQCVERPSSYISRQGLQGAVPNSNVLQRHANALVDDKTIRQNYLNDLARLLEEVGQGGLPVAGMMGCSIAMLLKVVRDEIDYVRDEQSRASPPPNGIHEYTCTLVKKDGVIRLSWVRHKLKQPAEGLPEACCSKTKKPRMVLAVNTRLALPLKSKMVNEPSFDYEFSTESESDIVPVTFHASR